jgi:hypothetical protein
MKITKTALQNLKKETDNNLKKDALQIAINNIGRYDKPEMWFEDLMSHGCSSGLIGELVYYTDTVKFFEKHKEEIFELAIDESENYGSSNVFDFLSGLNGANVGDYDQFANLMAWFAFETVIRQIYEQDFELEY